MPRNRNFSKFQKLIGSERKSLKDLISSHSDLLLLFSKLFHETGESTLSLYINDAIQEIKRSLSGFRFLVESLSEVEARIGCFKSSDGNWENSAEVEVIFFLVESAFRQARQQRPSTFEFPVPRSPVTSSPSSTCFSDDEIFPLEDTSSTTSSNSSRSIASSHGNGFRNSDFIIEKIMETEALNEDKSVDEQSLSPEEPFRVVRRRSFTNSEDFQFDLSLNLKTVSASDTSKSGVIVKQGSNSTLRIHPITDSPKEEEENSIQNKKVFKTPGSDLVVMRKHKDRVKMVSPCRERRSPSSKPSPLSLLFEERSVSPPPKCPIRAASEERVHAVVSVKRGREESSNPVPLRPVRSVTMTHRSGFVPREEESPLSSISPRSVSPRARPAFIEPVRKKLQEVEELLSPRSDGPKDETKYDNEHSRYFSASKRRRQTIQTKKQKKNSSKIHAVNFQELVEPQSEETRWISVEDILDSVIFRDPKSQKTFFWTYFRFTSSKVVMDSVLKLFCSTAALDDEKKSQAQESIRSFTSSWIEHNIDSLYENEANFLSLLEEIERSSDSKLLQEKYTLWKRKDSPPPIPERHDRPFRKEARRGSVPIENWKATARGKFQADEMAVVITFCQYKMLVKIKPVEMLSWNSKNRNCPDISNAIDFSTQLSNWVTCELVRTFRLEERKKLFEKFISLGEHLLRLKNFFGCKAILSGLLSTPVFGMKKTRERLDEEALITFEKLKSILSYKSNFSSYRAYLKGSQPPCLPLLRVCLADLTFLDDGNEDGAADLVNFRKWKMMSRAIESFTFFLSRNYPQFCRTDDLEAIFSESIDQYPYLTQEQIGEYSTLVEPKDPEEAMAKALELYQESQAQIAVLQSQLEDAKADKQENRPGLRILKRPGEKCG